jgi:hypothetical protein
MISEKQIEPNRNNARNSEPAKHAASASYPRNAVAPTSTTRRKMGLDLRISGHRPPPAPLARLDHGYQQIQAPNTPTQQPQSCPVVVRVKCLSMTPKDLLMLLCTRKAGSRPENCPPTGTPKEPEAVESGMKVLAASTAPSEVVYFPDSGEMTENQIEKRLHPLRSDILELKDNVAKLAGQPAAKGVYTQPVADNFVKRNAYWLWPTIAIVSGTGILSIVVDHRIDLKLTDPLKQIGDQAKSIAVLDTKQNNNSDLLKIVLQKEMSRTLALSPTEFKQELPQLHDILNAAQGGKTAPPTGLFADLDNKLRPFIKQRDAEAWNAAISLAEYRSIFNSDPRGDFAVVPVVSGQPGKVIYHPAGPTPPGDKDPQMNSSLIAAPKM